MCSYPSFQSLSRHSDSWLARVLCSSGSPGALLCPVNRADRLPRSISAHIPSFQELGVAQPQQFISGADSYLSVCCPVYCEIFSSVSGLSRCMLVASCSLVLMTRSVSDVVRCPS